MTTNPMFLGPWPQQTSYSPFKRKTSLADLAMAKEQINPENTFVTYLFKRWTTLEPFGELVNANIKFLNQKLSNSPQVIREAITIDPRVMHGNPVVSGTRVPVFQIIEELADGTTLQELPDCFPGVTAEKIQACLDFAVRLLRVYND